MRPNRALPTLAALAIGLSALAGCSDDPDAGSDGELNIVASTNVYGDIAAAVAGDLATVTSVITSAAQDPHEYEASAQDRLAIEDADIVIENGGGYDSFVDTLLESTENDPVVISAVDTSGLAPEDDEHVDEEDHAEEDHAEEDGHHHIEGFNEHVWYDLHAVEKIAAEISHELGEVDPDNASTYEENYEAFAGDIAALEAEVEDLRTTAEGSHAAITEPVPVYLLDEVGLENLTPEEFSEAVEEGADVPPRVLQETLDLFGEEEIAVLAYNSQTADETTEQVKAAAEDAGVPVLEFTETLPEGMSYVEWQQANVDNLAQVLE